MNGALDEDDKAVITPDYIQHLTVAAHAALTSVSRQEREAASDELLFLSSFDSWESKTKRLLPYCTDNCLRFMVCKAIYFMVANELGPQERAEMKSYVLDYCRSRRLAQEVLPTYVQHELYLVYACALFSNWKIAIISDLNHSQSRRGGGSGSNSTSMDDGDGGGNSTPSAFELAAQMVEELNTYLTPEQSLDCLREVIAYFSQHVAKAAIPSLRNACVHTILPLVFETAAQRLDEITEGAGEVCCAALECMSPLTNSGGLLTVKHTTEATIHILRWMDGWATSLQIALEYASGYLCANPTGPQARLMGRLVQLCSRIDSPHEHFVRSGREPIALKLLDVSSSLLTCCQEDNSGIPDLLLLSCEIFVNTFERHEEVAITFILTNFPGIIQRWADATQFVLGRFAEEDGDLRQLLMHLFYLIADRLLPRRFRQQRRGGMELEEAMRCGYDGDIPLTHPSSASDVVRSYVDAEGPLGGANAQELAKLIDAVFTTYLSSVVHKAHLSEDSDELRLESGVNLHNERTLYPLAEMLYCDKMDFQPTVMGWLESAIADFQVCAGARESALRSGGTSLMTPETLARLQAIVDTIDPSQIQRLPLRSDRVDPSDPSGGNMFRDFHQSPLSLFLMRVCLSRLSVLISLFAIAIQRNTHATSDEVLVAIGRFARQLLTDDDTLTSEMLLTLNVDDFDGYDSNSTDKRNGHGRQSVTAAPTLHIGILRSLFFFCNCVCESTFDRRPEFADIMLGLLRFVYLYHSDEPALMMDANTLFKRAVTEGPTTTHLLTSDKLVAVIQAVEEDAITGLRLLPPLSASPGQPLPLSVRETFYTALTSFVETRFYAGYGDAHVVRTILGRALSPARLDAFPAACLEEVIATTRGIQQPDTLLVALDAAMGSRAALVEMTMTRDPAVAALVVKWLALLCVLAKSLLEDDASSTTQWDLTSLVLGVATACFELLSRGPHATLGVNGEGYNSAGVTPLYAFPPDAVDADVVYDLADMLQVLCTAPWCNLGVVSFYERAKVENFFCGALQLLTSVSPPLLMASERGKRVAFSAMLTALTVEGPIFQNLHLVLMRQRVWPLVLEHLTRCLQYDYVPDVLLAMLVIVREDRGARARFPNYEGIGDRALAAAFHEVAVLIAVAPFLEMRQLSCVFEFLRICFWLAQEPCNSRMKALLGFCSAYHRVRLRTIWSMLMNNEPDMLERYVAVFGQSSKVATLSAW